VPYKGRETCQRHGPLLYLGLVQLLKQWASSSEEIIQTTILVSSLFTTQIDKLNLLRKGRGFKTGWITISWSLKGILRKDQLDGQDALVFVAGKWIKSTTTGLESASLRGRWHLSTRKFSMTQKLSCLFLLWCLTRDGALLCAHRHNSRRTQPNGWLIGLLNHGMFIGRILPSHFSLSVSAGFWSIAFVQSLANLEGLEKVAPFLRPVIEVNVVKSFLQGFLPGLALKIFLYILPTVLVIMSKVEGYVSLSSLERRTASKYYYFMLVNVFLGSIIAGTAFEQLYAFLHQLLCDQSRTRRNYNRMAMAYTWFFLEIVCATISMKIPFCKGWMCKSECWLQKKLRKVALKEHKCTKGGIRGRCHCLVCKDVPRLN